MTGPLPDGDAVIAIVRGVAAAEILPRFRNLAAGDVVAKRSPADLVTVADTEAERRLAAALTVLAPTSRVVGEEAAEHDPGLLAALAGPVPVWLVDPVDGTRNFAHGKPCFAVIVAYCAGGETLAGWIHDPLADATAWAVRGGGAWLRTPEGVLRLRTAAARPLESTTGSVGWRVARRVQTDRAQGLAVPARTVRYGCVGREYMDLGRGALDFALYTRLKPWDHAAGVLIHAEAGGFARLVDDGTPYRPAPAIQEATLLLAADRESWEALATVLAG
ncbi:MAG: inositol monophosphatase family protein [Rhodospirillales bacterium]